MHHLPSWIGPAGIDRNCLPRNQMHQMPSGELAQVGTYHCVRWNGMPHLRINEIWPEISYSLSPNPPFLVIIFRPKSITKIFVPRYKVSSRDQKPVGAPLLETVRSTIRLQGSQPKWMPLDAKSTSQIYSLERHLVRKPG